MPIGLSVVSHGQTPPLQAESGSVRLAWVSPSEPGYYTRVIEFDLSLLVSTLLDIMG